ncbi:MAG TPA: hypothetical protein VJB35_06050 [Candidatus Nanoarchaeia archaeon]|nr:hypothetical protein [Candidatus Nanoarchaeia archaeon]
MTDSNSQEYRTFFLKQFTRQLIKNSGTGYIFSYEHLIQKKEAKEEHEKKKLVSVAEQEIYLPKKEKIKQVVHRFEVKKILPFEKQEEPFFPRPQKMIQPTNIAIQPSRKLVIPQTRLPEYLQHIKPIPSQTQINLKKLNKLVNDPMVQYIECIGENENILVNGKMGLRKTEIILDREEISEIIDIFSEAARIPVSEGIFRVAVGKLILSAIVSDVVSTKFTIQKMNPLTSGINPQIRRNF